MAKTVIIPRPLYTRPSGSKPKDIIGKYTETGCLECISHACSENEYASTSFGGKKDKIHRWVYKLHNGEIPKGMVIRHTCDNPKCINIKHLLLGTYSDNEKDKKERNRTAIGEKVGTSKLTEKEVIKIKKLLKTNITQREISKMFNVHFSTISLIKVGKHWKYLDEK